MLQAFSDESYLYNYIVNNYSELAEDNIFRNPTFLKKLEEMIYFSKNNISVDDIELIEGLLFISMISLHSDYPKRQLAFFVQGIKILNKQLGVMQYDNI